MALKIFFIVIFFPMLANTNFSQVPPIEAGVPKQLATWRSAHYSAVRYKLNLTLEKMSPTLKGTIEISLNNKADQIILDWRKIRGSENLSTVSNILVNGKAEKFAEINEHLVFKDGVKTGENSIKIDFTSPILKSGSAITRYVDKEDGSEYIYSLFVPSDASLAFPVFDQPDLKARFSLKVRTDYLIVISNTRVNRVQTAECAVNTKCFKTLWFIETQPISTYVFAFAAGNFAEVSEPSAVADGLTQRSKIFDKDSKIKNQPLATANGSDLPMRIFVRKSQAKKFEQHAQEVFRLNRECVKYLEEYFNYKFPFPKYDLVLIPEFPFGGMEHAGATFLRESSVIFPSEPTKSDLINRANLIFHEAAHQWFGDTVTMKWFDDLWLKEGFATFMAYKAMEQIMPEYNAWKVFYERTKQGAYQTDSTKGTVPIYQDIPNLSAAKSAYGNIVYNKAPAFLRQAEFYLGEKEFQTAVRQFLKKHEFSNATWQDLVKEFKSSAPKELTTGDERLNIDNFSNRWIRESGLPITKSLSGVHNIWKPIKEKGWSDKSDFEVKGSNKNQKDNRWTQKINYLGVFAKDKPKTANVTFKYAVYVDTDVILSSRVVEVSSYTEAEPLLVFPNYQDYGYGIFLLDEKSRNYILANVQNEKDDFLRSMMYGSLWDSVREAELNPKDYVELVIKNVAEEKDEMIVASMLGRANMAMNYYLDDKTRESLVLKLEEVLIIQFTSARTKSLRTTFYRTFLNMVSTKQGAFALDNVLDSNITATPAELEAARKEESNINPSGKFAGLPILSTKDKFDAVTKLLTLNYETALKRLAEIEKIETSDDAKRYAYAARAGIANAESKAKYWNDFVNNKEISESWIEAAFVPFNSVRHADLTLPYLEKALNELPNHKKTRKIFFVNGWLGAFVGGQKSEEALNVVNKFLENNPNLDKDLRLKILENVDVIERAVKIRKKFNQ